ncbi:hypothetical protein DOQ73_24220 [Salmonella enterica subsp. enterica]|nr:hypothetical protein [Salmonella enterica subsp. enterica serovar Javiana]
MTAGITNCTNLAIAQAASSENAVRAIFERCRVIRNSAAASRAKQAENSNRSKRTMVMAWLTDFIDVHNAQGKRRRSTEGA